MSRQVPDDDLRHNRATEVRIRLAQLDRILTSIDNAIVITRANPRDVEQRNTWAADNYSALQLGHISVKEWIDGTSLPAADPEELMNAFDAVILFTEAFYFFAWRLVEALNAKSPDRFPALDKVRAKGIRDVRNHLLQHPERHGSNFLQSMVITDAGPVLRSAGLLTMFATGETRPMEDSVDKGLFITARELQDELQIKFDRAIERLRPSQRP